MRILVACLLVITTLLAGCIGYSEPQHEYTPPEPDSPPSNIVLPGEPPADRTWISPGKVNIGNFYPGGRVEYPITIHNGNDSTCSFLVSYRYPDHVGEDYVKPPPEAQNWVIIADETPLLMPKETREVSVALSMPRKANTEPKKWEFWVSVIDTTQKGMVKTELCVRWLVNMR